MTQPALFTTSERKPPPEAGIPTWLRQHLTNIGAWNIDGISRRARATRCGSCNERTLAGLDDERCAGVAIADPGCVTEAIEVLAILSGRRTYRLRVLASRIELDRRNQFHIAGTPASETDVVVEHRCGAYFGGTDPQHSWQARKQPTDTGDDPPF